MYSKNKTIDVTLAMWGEKITLYTAHITKIFEYDNPWVAENHKRIFHDTSYIQVGRMLYHVKESTSTLKNLLEGRNEPRNSKKIRRHFRR